MILRDELPEYLDEIKHLLGEHLGEEVEEGSTVFAALEGQVLMAAALVKEYQGHWYLRSCVVKPEFRGRGLQRRLLRERLDYLAERTKAVRVSVFPDNVHSIRNIVAEGFEFERKKQVWNGTVDVYRRSLRQHRPGHEE